MINTVVENGKTYANINDLTEWAENKELRAVGPDAFRRLKAQIQELGEYKPLLVTPEGIVLGGNTRLRAYRELGYQRLWVSVINTRDKNDLLKYNLSDNDNVGLYNENGLANLLSDYELNMADFAVDFDEPIVLEDIDGMKEVETVEDEGPEVSNEPAVSQLGQVYQLGRHRLICGDATKIEDVEKLMNGQKADMVFTDPPYGYSYESNHQDKHEELLNDDKILDFFPLAVSVTTENAPIYTFCGWQTVDKWINIIKQNGLSLKNIIIWKKNNWSMGDLEGAYAGQYEILLYCPKGRILLEGERDRDVWEFNREEQNDHPTKKPIALINHALQNHKANIILDLFGGSGSTLIACEQTNRQCFMMELDPQYCDVIRKRYAKFIGKEAEWEASTPCIA